MRLLVPSAALLWGLQIAFHIPTLALILVTLYDASTAEVGWVLTVYNARHRLLRRDGRWFGCRTSRCLG
jgi:hypothetical protein